MFQNTNEKVNVIGTYFDNLSMKEVTESVVDFMENYTDKNLFIVTANPEIVYYARKNSEYMSKLKTADIIVPDGIGIVKASRKLGTELKERVPGIELMENILIEANKLHKRVFLLGASKETVKLCQANLKELYPNIKFKSKHGYKDITDYKRLQQVKKFKPDIVFVAMGYPKQENWIFYNRPHFKNTVFMGVGGSFDVFSGRVKRAPHIFIKLNLEWLYRLLKDFKRIKRIIIIPLFLLEIIKQKRKPFNYEQELW
ncbi:WecB/TagA/CpsF family glycosyltransferase [Macrococcoides canis]|uniref:WecB/TagA/CpsF family glycosyltransferase n=1 Tax=Macrococcoides canis TaxID=1855823 RepID=UPI001B8BCC70|nr:WecB/TagA/CpsF family glycosyltransferase [Macrococcus canis]QUR93832.1 WecB/TagA/CpsF family glycosyltransferase [Macrococcus canis]UTH07643.1 WecB/TagA/CpsF family glycosyltransferase [Macrococcus canis]